MYPNLFGVEFLHTYGLCIGIGIILTLSLLDLYAKKEKIDRKFYNYFYFLGVISIVFGFIFAALAQSLYNYIDNPSAGFAFGDMTFIGGLIGGVSVFLILYFSTKGYKLGKLSLFLPIVPCCITLSHAFGRIGCFFAGCCYGIETDAWFGLTFPGMTQKVIPIQLFEAIFLFILFLALCFIVYKKKGRYSFSIYFIIYGIWRFIIENYRGDERGTFIGSISPSQFWSIILILIGIGYFIFIKFKNESRDQDEL